MAKQRLVGPNTLGSHATVLVRRGTLSIESLAEVVGLLLERPVDQETRRISAVVVGVNRDVGSSFLHGWERCWVEGLDAAFVFEDKGGLDCRQIAIEPRRILQHFERAIVVFLELLFGALISLQVALVPLTGDSIGLISQEPTIHRRI